MSSALLPAGTSISGRLRCAACQRPQTACICVWVRPTQNQVAVLILQHPLEAKVAKGSARLLHLGLERCELLVGEVFASDLLTRAGQPACPALHDLLLYPDDTPGLSATAPLAVRPAQAVRPAPCAGVPLPPPAKIRLIVIDAT